MTINVKNIIESTDQAIFTKDLNGNYLIIDGDKELQLKDKRGRSRSDKTNNNWNAIAVEPNEEKGYDVLLQGQNKLDGKAYVWTTNSEGVITSGSGWKKQETMLSWETKFDVDLNGDGTIGNSFTIIEEKGAATFAKNADSTYWIIDGEKELQLKNQRGGSYSDETTNNWNAIAVEPNEEEGYDVLLQGQNKLDGKAYVWTTNSEGVITRGSGWKKEETMLSWETKFDVDLNGDEIIGNSFTIVEEKGTATFAKDLNGTYFIIDGNKELQVKSKRRRSYNDTTNSYWNIIAAESNDSESYDLLLQGQNKFDGKAAIWTTNSEGVITSGSGWKVNDDLLPLENTFEVDLNGDGVIN